MTDVRDGGSTRGGRGRETRVVGALPRWSSRCGGEDAVEREMCRLFQIVSELKHQIEGDRRVNQWHRLRLQRVSHGASGSSEAVWMPQQTAKCEELETLRVRWVRWVYRVYRVSSKGDLRVQAHRESAAADCERSRDLSKGWQ